MRLMVTDSLVMQAAGLAGTHRKDCNRKFI
jgi:hypothetical protein